MIPTSYYNASRMTFPFNYPVPAYSQMAPIQPYWPSYEAVTVSGPSMGNRPNNVPGFPAAPVMSGIPNGSNIMNMPLQPNIPGMMNAPAGAPFASPVYAPYPKMPQKPQPNQVNSIISQFKTSDGNLDINKMMNTAGQMMSAVNQLTNMVKGFSGIFKA